MDYSGARRQECKFLRVNSFTKATNQRLLVCLLNVGVEALQLCTNLLLIYLFDMPGASKVHFPWKNPAERLKL